uniref:Uncharacterized protein n=1 Tax=Anolis carolinensis TaxID=28377 RepID=A0A803T0Q7_ANOCA
SFPPSLATYGWFSFVFVKCVPCSIPRSSCMRSSLTIGPLTLICCFPILPSLMESKPYSLRLLPHDIPASARKNLTPTVPTYNVVLSRAVIFASSRWHHSKTHICFLVF